MSPSKDFLDQTAAPESRIAPNVAINADLRGLFENDLGQEARAQAAFCQVDPDIPEDVFWRPLLAGARRASVRAKSELPAAELTSGSLRGDLESLPFPRLALNLEGSRRSGVLSIAGPTAVGRLFFDQGRLVHAVFGNLMGADAFGRLLQEVKGEFEFSPEACRIPPARRSIAVSVASLLEQQRDVQASGFDESSFEPPALSARVPRGRPSTGTLDVGFLRQTLPVSGGVANTLESALTSAEQHGSFHAWSKADLALWTESEQARARFHVLLYADMMPALGALVALGDAQARELLIQKLEAGAEAFGLSFRLQPELLLDVVLVDIRRPSRLSESLRREPALSIVAPPQGELSILGARASVELETALTWRRSKVLLVVGNPSLDEAVNHLKSSQAGVVVARHDGVLGSEVTDLRALLTTGIRLWAPYQTPTSSAPSQQD